jgi:hypothetical protein
MTRPSPVAATPNVEAFFPEGGQREHGPVVGMVSAMEGGVGGSRDAQP